MKSKKWNIARPNIGAIRSLAKTCGYAPLTAAVLCARGLDTPEKAQTFLAHDLSGLHDPFLLPDMHAAVEAIDNAIANGEHIAVFGDYDVDGITSTCVLVRYLKSRGAACRYYIPDRLSEGYGLNKPALLKLRDSGVSMVITVDSGITAVEEIAYANEIGLKVVVTDHHECKDDLPDAAAVVNPKRTDSTYPFKDLAGVGVVFKLVCALEGPENLEQVVTTYLDLVAVGTIADVMRLQGENRVIVTYGLLLLQQTDNPGLRMLMREAGVETRRMTASVVSFTLAPRINAAGRMGCADEAAQLFLTDSPSHAQEIAALLCCQNKERQNAENEILRQAYEVLQKEYDPQEDRMIVLWGENWHHGVIGIVSSRISDRYGCGHALAAGLTISRDMLPAFKQSICAYAKKNITEEDLMPVINIDCLISPDDISMESIRELGILEPYGMGNREPIFAIREMTVEEITPISSDRHLKMSLVKGNRRFTAMLFGTGSGGCPVVQGDIVDAAFSLEINHFRNQQTIQLMLKDIRLSDCELERDHYFLSVYSHFINGESLTDSQVNQLYPNRPDLVAVWRHIISQAEDKKLTAPYNTLSRRISYESRQLINIGKLFVCLDVFSESRLLNYHFKNNLLYIRILPFQGKADITKSVVLATLRHRKRQSTAEQQSG